MNVVEVWSQTPSMNRAEYVRVSSAVFETRGQISASYEAMDIAKEACLLHTQEFKGQELC